MVFGLSKTFFIVVIIAVIAGYGFKNWLIGFEIIFAYAAVKILFNLVVQEFKGE